MAADHDDWAFFDAKDLAVITVSGVVVEGRPVLRVSHDRDGCWQFLEWETPAESDARVVLLEEMIRFDPSLDDLADLPRGWRAIRRFGGDPWYCEPNPFDTSTAHDPE